MNLPDDIKDSKIFFEKAEWEQNPEAKLDYLTDAIDILESYIEESKDCNLEVQKYISNIKMAHTRRLIDQLLSMKDIEIEPWLSYIVLLVTKLKSELEFLTETDVHLKQQFNNFMKIWKKELLEAYSLYEKSHKKKI